MFSILLIHKTKITPGEADKIYTLHKYRSISLIARRLFIVFIYISSNTYMLYHFFFMCLLFVFFEIMPIYFFDLLSFGGFIIF